MEKQIPFHASLKQNVQSFIFILIQWIVNMCELEFIYLSLYHQRRSTSVSIASVSSRASVICFHHFTCAESKNDIRIPKGITAVLHVSTLKTGSAKRLVFKWMQPSFASNKTFKRNRFEKHPLSLQAEGIPSVIETPKEQRLVSSAKELNVLYLTNRLLQFQFSTVQRKEMCRLQPAALLVLREDISLLELSFKGITELWALW